ncbi:39S ribosomal protein L54, mitochondrial-like [Eriocheir sinensis]|uniref:39S ribosomal protein L54, mitochondrial-like n=1 Tax=Eriocheir sinensis TaxID=95602 RepID=UPI0021C90269|nr:39S ribosomal protein L54, mitochondrial-like [Eriocheir sinensis]
MAVCRGRLFSLFSLHGGPSAAPRLLLPAAASGTQQQRHYAKPLAGLGKKGGKTKLGPTVEKVRLPVETDPEKLVNYVCGSHPVKEDRQDIKLGPDEDYPDWLWTLRTGKPPPLEEMDPNTKQYWRKLRTMAMREKNKLRKTQRF